MSVLPVTCWRVHTRPNGSLSHFEEWRSLPPPPRWPRCADVAEFAAREVPRLVDVVRQAELDLLQRLALWHAPTPAQGFPAVTGGAL